MGLLSVLAPLSFGQSSSPTVQGAPTSLLYPASSPNYRLFAEAEPPLIPSPQEVTWAKKALTLKNYSLSLPEKSEYPEQIAFMKKGLEVFLRDHALTPAKGGYPIAFKLMKEPLKETSPDAILGQNESYKLVSTPQGVTIEASTTKGLFYGMQTLKQLILRRDAKTTLALATIVDYPTFPIRGFMNDTGRNYMDMSLLKEEVEAMAQYKYNVYHFHLTDNYGWRLESKKYPELQKPESFERKPGKFYTQAQLVDFVEFCRLRGITVIVELDMPGHTKSFRKALGIENMEDPRATKVLTEVIEELANLVPAEKMPYIHIGTDEAHGPEVVSQKTLQAYFDAVKKAGRQAIRWQPGMSVKGDNTPIQQTWTGRSRLPAEGARYIDSQENYINHFDPLEAITTLFFRKNCSYAPKSTGLGGILCSWPDIYIEDERAHLYQSPVYPTMVAYSEAIWRDPRVSDDLAHYTNLPKKGDEKLKEFQAFEDKMVAHRDRFFRGKEFPFVRHSPVEWKILGPMANGNKPETVFPVEEGPLKESYTVGDKTYTWSEETYPGGTVIFKHYCDYPTFVNPHLGKQEVGQATYYARTYVYSPKNQVVDFWVSGHYWPTSDFRSGAVGVPGKWFHTDPKFIVNGKALEAPQWQVPNRNTGKLNDPWVDENYHWRKPTPVSLKKGWNTVLIKSPHSTNARRWMFTFVPVLQNKKDKLNCNVREVSGLKFSAELPK